MLIIGAGPAGLMASTAFASAGVNFRAIDKEPKPVATGQADGIMPRTVEVFQVNLLAHVSQRALLTFVRLVELRPC